MLQMEEEKITRLRAAWPFWCFLALVVLLLPPMLIDSIPQRDVAFRYAPMAEAFRDGDFIYAFHPRTGFLHTFIAGIFAWVLQCNGFLACKLSSLLFMGLAVFPLYGIMRRAYSRSMAEICTFAYILASQLQRLGWSGLRDAHKCFLILLAGYALVMIYQERERWCGYICLGVAAGFGMITRGDMVLFMALLFFWGIVMELQLKKIPYRSICGGILTVVLALPAVVLNWYVAGVAVPEIRFAWIFRKLMNRYPGLEDTLPLIAVGLICAFFAAWAVRRIVDAGYGKILGGIVAVAWLALLVWQIRSPEFYCEITVRAYLGAVLKGFFPVFAITGLIGIGFRLKRKEWKTEESILAALLFGHALLICSQIFLNDHYLYVSSRYLVPAMPLELGWSVIGILALWEILARPFREHHPKLVQNVGGIAFAVTICVFLYDFYTPVIREYLTAKGQNYLNGLKSIAEVVRTDYRGPAQFRPEVDPGKYIPKLNPAVLYLAVRGKKPLLRPYFGHLTVTAYMAGGRVTEKLAEADYVVEKYRPGNKLQAGLFLLHEIKIGKETYRIWKMVK